MLDHALRHALEGGERGAAARHAQHDLAQHRVVEDPAAGFVARRRAPFAPGRERLQQPQPAGVPALDAPEPQPCAFGVDRHDIERRERRELFVQPSEAPEPLELAEQPLAQRQQVADVVERVLDLRLAEGAARPIGAGLAFRHLALEQPPGEFGVADLRGEAGERRGDLRVEQRCHGAEQRREHLEVLPPGMQHLRGAARAQRRAQRPQVLERERVDAHRAAARGELQQAELRPVGALAHELGVETDGALVFEVAEQRFEAVRRGDDVRVRRHPWTMQESGPKG